MFGFNWLKRKKNRKFPCQAIAKVGPNFMKLAGISTNKVEVTVLEDSRYYCCCSEVVHPVELPDGCPEPPEGCSTWMTRPGNLTFI